MLYHMVGDVRTNSDLVMLPDSAVQGVVSLYIMRPSPQLSGEWFMQDILVFRE